MLTPGATQEQFKSATWFKMLTTIYANRKKMKNYIQDGGEKRESKEGNERWGNSEYGHANTLVQTML